MEKQEKVLVNRELLLEKSVKLICRVCDQNDAQKQSPAEIAILPDLLKVVLDYLI